MSDTEVCNQSMAGGLIYTQLHGHPVAGYLCASVRFFVTGTSVFAGSILTRCKLVPHILGRQLRPVNPRLWRSDECPVLAVRDVLGFDDVLGAVFNNHLVSSYAIVCEPEKLVGQKGKKIASPGTGIFVDRGNRTKKKKRKGKKIGESGTRTHNLCQLPRTGKQRATIAPSHRY